MLGRYAGTKLKRIHRTLLRDCLSMIMKKNVYFLILLSGLFLFGCSSEKNRHEKIVKAILDANQLTLTEFRESGGFIGRNHIEIRHNKKFKVLPSEIGQLKNLEELVIFKTNLSELPEEIGQLTNLVEIDLAENRLNELPESIGNLTKLRKLSLYNNNLRKLPESIGNLSLLEEIELNGNDLESLPKSIKNWKKVAVLFLYYNKLSELPRGIAGMESLYRLYLNNNQFKKFPLVVLKIPHLKDLNLKDNPMDMNSIPIEVRKKSFPHGPGLGFQFY